MTMPGPTPTGTLTVDGGHVTMTFVRRLDHPPETVWAALTDPDERAGWFGKTTIDARAGGTIEMDPDGPPAKPDQIRMTGRILVWDPPHVLEHEWRQPMLGSGAAGAADPDLSVVRYELIRDGDGTVLTFTHRGLLPGTASGFIPGTHAYLDRLTAHLAGQPIPNWQARYEQVAPAYS